jgi:hypothetical protein
VSAYHQEVHREKHRLESQKETLETAFRVASDELLASDRRVTGLPAIEDRTAMINLILRDERREIEKLGQDIRSLGHVEKAIRLRSRELEGTMTAIRTQKALIDMELRTGSFYGDENDTSRGTVGFGKQAVHISTPSTDIDENEMARLMNEATAEVASESNEPQPNGLLCSICYEPQMASPSGPFCSNGHGGADGIDPKDKPAPEAPVTVTEPQAAAPAPTPQPKPEPVVEPPKAPSAMPSSDDDFSEFLLGAELDGAQFAPKSKRIISNKAKSTSQAVVPNQAQSTKEASAEDPDITRFLDHDESDEFASLFDGI